MSQNITLLSKTDCESVSAGSVLGAAWQAVLGIGTVLETAHLIWTAREIGNFAIDRHINNYCDNIPEGDHITKWFCNQ